MTLLKSIIAATATCTLTACIINMPAITFPAFPSDKTDADIARLQTTNWTVTHINGASIIKDKPTIRFDQDSQIKGSASCNDYTGRYHADGDAMMLTDIATHSKRTCAAFANQQEKDFLKELVQVNSWSYSSTGQLILSAPFAKGYIVATPDGK